MYPPLEHSSRILADRGWQVLVLGTGAPGALDSLRFPPHPSIRVRKLPYARPGPFQKLHYILFVVWTVAVALVWRPDWIYVSDFLASIPGLLLRRLLGERIVYHEHDAPGLGTDSQFARLCLAARSRLAREAQLCVLPNPERARVFQHELRPPSAVACVANFPRLDEVQPARNDAVSSPILRVYYHGTIGEPLLPPTLIKALSHLDRAVRLCLVGHVPFGQEGYLDQLLRMAQQLGVADNIELHQSMSRFLLWPKLREQDVGLALISTSSGNLNLQHLLGASNKVTDYLAAGAAVLVPDLRAWREVFVEPGYGLACNRDDPASIAAALDWFLAHPRETHAMGERGRQRVLTEWHYEREFAPVLGIMETSRQAGGGSANRNRFAKHASVPPGP